MFQLQGGAIFDGSDSFTFIGDNAFVQNYQGAITTLLSHTTIAGSNVFMDNSNASPGAGFNVYVRAGGEANFCPALPATGVAQESDGVSNAGEDASTSTTLFWPR
jgi:hypothetical protein